MESCNAETAYYFLLGKPVAHSLSPLIHNTGFQALGINAVYLAAPVEESELDAAVKGLKALASGGCNVTSPYKEAVIPCLDEVAADAKIIKSVNTIINRNGTLFGTSTDGEGFYNSLLKAVPQFDLKQPVLLIGAGGSARAVAYTLAKKGLRELYLANRSLELAQSLATLLERHTPLKKSQALPLTGNNFREALAACHLVVYCLPLDVMEVETALGKMSFKDEGKIFFDLRYSPAETLVMKAAALAGAKTINGLGLLLSQALLAFELFTGRAAPAEKMEQALQRCMEAGKQR